jgi:hypothetical protein
VNRLFIGALLLALTLTPSPGLVTMAADTTPRRFASPEEAMTALLQAVKADDRQALVDILGPQSRSLLFSSDDVADRAARQRFADEYDRTHRLEGGDGKVVLYVGQDEFPFAVPLVPDGPAWRFDAKKGMNELVNRRIGRNELDAIQVCMAYADAQQEYFAEDRNANGLREYARRFISTPGQRDGLFWETKPGEKPSPLGSLVAQAQAEGYRPTGRGTSAPSSPYHGYYYRILTGQGPHAPDGAYDYVAHGHMIGGFALVAFPAQYGGSGVMTFIVNHDGVVYQKDLGPNTAADARKMTRFDPDTSWRKVEILKE